MELKRLIDDLETIKSLIKKWDAEGTIPVIEHDIAMANLQQIYEKLMFVSVDNEETSVEFMFDDNLSDQSDEYEYNENDEYLIQKVVAETEPGKIIEIRPHPESPVEKVIREDRLNNPEGSMPIYHEKPPEDNSINTSETGKVSVSESEKSNFPEPEKENDAETEKSNFPEPEKENGAETEKDEANISETEKDESGSTILFGQEILKELYAQFVQELFKDDEQYFCDEVDKLINQSNFDDALFYISENYNWSARSETAEKFASLLEEYTF